MKIWTLTRDIFHADLCKKRHRKSRPTTLYKLVIVFNLILQLHRSEVLMRQLLSAHRIIGKSVLVSVVHMVTYKMTGIPAMLQQERENASSLSQGFAMNWFNSLSITYITLVIKLLNEVE